MTSLNKHSILQELIDLAEQNNNEFCQDMAELASQLRSADSVDAYYEQKHANASVRLMRDIGSCPTCGAEDHPRGDWRDGAVGW